MSRLQKTATKLIPALALSAILVLAACSQEASFPPAENDQMEEKTTQESKPTTGTTAGGTTAPGSTSTSTDGAASPEEGSSGDSGNAATQKVAPWSDPADYEYYYDLPIPGYDIDVKTVLRKQIIPQAVNALLETFPKTFGYLKDWVIGFGLEYYDMGEDNSMEAFFKLTPGFGDDPSKAGDATYGMVINSQGTSINAYTGGVLEDRNRTNLEILCVHELMHAMMYETLTCGMSGYTPSGEEVTSFPDWFKEGTAEAACGGRLKRIVESGYTIDDIKAVLKEKKLTDDNTTSQYAVGWLAVMYLAYLANGGSVERADLANGLDTFLLEIHGGTSLSEAINIHSKQKYSNLKVFEEKFDAGDEDVAIFVKKLMEKIGTERGSLVPDIEGFLPNEDCESKLFWVHFSRPYSYLNNYGDALNGYQIYEGGAADYQGEPGAFNPCVQKMQD